MTLIKIIILLILFYFIKNNKIESYTNTSDNYDFGRLIYKGVQKKIFVYTW